MNYFGFQQESDRVGPVENRYMETAVVARHFAVRHPCEGAGARNAGEPDIAKFVPLLSFQRCGADRRPPSSVRRAGLLAVTRHVVLIGDLKGLNRTAYVNNGG